MKPEIRLSTRFAAAANTHQVGLLVTLAGERVERRPPINVALVLDRSGSMAGEPLAAARVAAARFAGFLGPDDRLSIVTFDQDVATLFGPAPAGDPDAVRLIERIAPGGQTNLSGGWLAGLRHVRTGRVQGTNRVVLLTDGQANHGITSARELELLAAGAAGDSVSTTTIGFGAQFNEDLLAAMGRAGGGNYWYVESRDQMGDIFAGEVEGLVALAAQQVTVEVRLVHPRAAGMTLLQDWPVTRTDEGGWQLALGDLYAGAPRNVGLRFHVEHAAELGPVPVAEVTVVADVITTAGIVHRRTTMPVLATLDGVSHPEPVVEETFLRYAVAQARREATEHADRGDLDGAAQCLGRMVRECRASDSAVALAEEIGDLNAMRRRYRDRSYGASDRKYNLAMSVNELEEKRGYVERVRRKGPRG